MASDAFMPPLPCEARGRGHEDGFVLKPGSVFLSRTPIAGRKGAVACGHQEAAELGLDALRRGGNAIDAAIAGAFASFVVEPQMCGIGGHGRLSVYLADRGQAIGIDHFIRAPKAATPEVYAAALTRWRNAGWGGTEGAINTTGHLSVGIPGTVAGLWEAHRRFARLPWRSLVGPAIELARAGIAADARLTLSIAGRTGEIRQHPEAAALLLPDNAPPRPANAGGALHRFDFSDMAKTLEAIAEKGAAAFYDGPLAAAIDAEMRKAGGLLTAEDLAGYKPDTFQQPWYEYRGRGYVTCGDLIFAETLNILERFDLGSLGQGSAESFHLIAEALAQSFADSFAHAADPRHLKAPLEGLASKAFAAVQAARIRTDRAQRTYAPGDPWPHQGPTPSVPPPPFEGTTQIAAADADGNMASLITSLGSAFGSLVLIPGTGVFLGNAMQWFDPTPGRANSVGPGRMPLYAAPVAIFREGGRALGAIAGSGGYRIQPAVLFAAINRLDYGVDPQRAIDLPRIHTEGEGLEVDTRIAASVTERLKALGHCVRPVDGSGLPTAFGRPSAVWRAADGSLIPASDARSGGVAAF
ncbi:MAG: gamma-glutamyltransferase family protein [Alphaproteobacteria bacterium]|nr:gamma-glutamyltransferase family protein [Alphaproteobacteria bacterium]